MERERFQNEFYLVAIPDRFVEHGGIDQLKEEIGMDAEAIAIEIKKRIQS